MANEKKKEITLHCNVVVKGVIYKKGVKHEVAESVYKTLEQFKAEKKKKK